MLIEAIKRFIRSLVPQQSVTTAHLPRTLTFTLTPVEENRLEEFRLKHKKCPDSSTIGGKYTYKITPTGLGECIVVECNSCGIAEDITDIDSW